MLPPLRMITVCVNYADILAITLPYNRHHFSESYIVVDPLDYKTQEVAEANKIDTIPTSLFYAKGAAFNKWAALEYGLDVIGRKGWICLMDADVLWPKVLPDEEYEIGKLYTPMRHMFEDTSQPIPPESEWHKYEIHRNVNEWAGYSQIFHASDPALGNAPWHETCYTHAGISDSFFQRKWKPENKIRPKWNCLHIGEAGQNWYGRATKYLDGTLPEGAQEKRAQCRTIWDKRRQYRAAGIDEFKDERL